MDLAGECIQQLLNLHAATIQHITENSGQKFDSGRLHTLDTTLGRISETVTKVTVLVTSPSRTKQTNAHMIQGMPKPPTITNEHCRTPASNHRQTTTTPCTMQRQLITIDIHGLTSQRHLDIR